MWACYAVGGLSLIPLVSTQPGLSTGSFIFFLTLFAAVWLWDVYRYQPISHSVQWFSSETHIGISPYHTLCSGFHCETYIGISLYHTLYSGFHSETCISISLYHTLCSAFHSETYIGISPYHTLGVVWTAMYGCNVIVTWSCEKKQMLFIFRVIWKITAFFQWIRSFPKGSHLIHWTSAVYSHIIFK